MSDRENGSVSPSARQALAMLFRVAASQVVESETPPAFAHAIAGSIRHRGNKVERCDAAELREVAAALRALAEVLLVCDARMARGLQGVAFCVETQLDKETHVDVEETHAHVESLFDGSEGEHEWRVCSECRRSYIRKPHDNAPCWWCSQRRAKAAGGES